MLSLALGEYKGLLPTGTGQGEEPIVQTGSEASPGQEPSALPAADGAMTVHFIDVGQGDSLLAESDGHFLLVDAGENDQGDTVIAYLREAGVTSLDYVIGTHPHSDHIGGLDDVIRAFDVKAVILPPVAHTTKTFEDVLDAVQEKNLTLTQPKPGDSYALGDAAFTILAPQADYGDDLNNWSVGIRLACAEGALVACGDAEAPGGGRYCSKRPPALCRCAEGWPSRQQHFHQQRIFAGRVPRLGGDFLRGRELLRPSPRRDVKKAGGRGRFCAPHGPAGRHYRPVGGGWDCLDLRKIGGYCMRWIIDRLEDALAMCEDEKGELIPISRDKLPENAREGDVLREEGGHFSLSPEETESRRREMKKKLMDLFG